jgi:hypothetical protein
MFVMSYVAATRYYAALAQKRARSVSATIEATITKNDRERSNEYQETI